MDSCFFFVATKMKFLFCVTCTPSIFCGEQEKDITGFKIRNIENIYVKNTNTQKLWKLDIRFGKSNGCVCFSGDNDPRVIGTMVKKRMQNVRDIDTIIFINGWGLVRFGVNKAYYLKNFNRFRCFYCWNFKLLEIFSESEKSKNWNYFLEISGFIAGRIWFFNSPE